MLNLIVSNPIDRIQRGGGSVVVSATGGVAVDAIAAAGGYLRNAGVNKLYWDSAGVTIPTILTVTGTSSHTFSGPVFASVTTSDALRASYNAAGAARVVSLYRSSVRKGHMALEATDDWTFFTNTGAAGSEVPTEALRIVNANGNVSTPTRFGVGTAAPGYPVDVQTQVSGVGINSGYGIIGASNNAGTAAIKGITYVVGGYAGFFQQNAASSTVPVVVVKLGATPGVGGDAQQWQNSSGSILAKFTSAGVFTGNNGAGMWFNNTSSPNTLLGNTGNDIAHVIVALKGMVGQTGDLFQAQNSGSVKNCWITADGVIGTIAANTQATVGAAGAAAALPGAPLGYKKHYIDGTLVVSPYWAAA